MQTNFSKEQLKVPQISRSNEILRSCVHCGFCTATCPTYQVLGDELDSPRGRIYLIKEMLENDRPADAKTVKHIDRCLSCLACMSTCPSGVHYMHLVDHARAHIEETYRRPFFDRTLRGVLARLIPYPKRFRAIVRLAGWLRSLTPIVPKKIRPMLALAPKKIPPNDGAMNPQAFLAEGKRRMRVALLTGCAQKVLNTEIHKASVRLLTRLGCDVVVLKGEGCCGALPHHMGKINQSHKMAVANIMAAAEEIRGQGLDAIVSNTSGCGTTLKDYGHMLKNTGLEEEAEAFSSLVMDISEISDRLNLQPENRQDIGDFCIAYHAACSLQHGQAIKSVPKTMLKNVGFKVVEPVDPHLCCGSAGTYNLLQPEISEKLKARKLSSLGQLNPDVIATGNIGCMTQLATGSKVPIVHTVQLLDWATGGPKPPELELL